MIDEIEKKQKAIELYSRILEVIKDCYFSDRKKKDEIITIVSDLLLAEVKGLIKE
jgi:hypothetical protein